MVMKVSKNRQGVHGEAEDAEGRCGSALERRKAAMGVRGRLSHQAMEGAKSQRKVIGPTNAISDRCRWMTPAPVASAAMG